MWLYMQAAFFIACHGCEVQSISLGIYPRTLQGAPHRLARTGAPHLKKKAKGGAPASARPPRGDVCGG